MKKAALLLCLSMPAFGSTSQMRAPHRAQDRTPHNRTPTASTAGLFSKSKSVWLNGHVGHRTTKK